MLIGWKVMKTFELTQDAIDMLCECIRHRIGYLDTINKAYVESRKEEVWCDEIVKTYNKNVTDIVKLQTLLCYLES